MNEQYCSFLRPLMELNKDLKCLIERAWAINGKLDCEIEQSIKLCKFCSEHGRLCDVADQIPVEERQSLIAIRDSLKQVENILLFQQKLLCWQEREKNEAVIRLKESRTALMELVRSYEAKAPDVLRELNVCFSDEDVVVLHSFKDCEPNKKWWKHYWPKPFGFAMKCLMFSATISYMIRFNHNSSSRSKIPSFLGSTQAQVSRTKTPLAPLNVFHARG